MRVTHLAPFLDDEVRKLTAYTTLFVSLVQSRNNYAAAKLQGLMEDLKLSDQDYQTGLSILFVGYLLMQVPSNLMLNYMGRPSLYIGTCVVVWGFVSALTSQVQSYSGIVACRFFLGFVGMFCSFSHTYARALSLPRQTHLLGVRTHLLTNTQIFNIQRPHSSEAHCFTCPNGTPRRSWPSE